MCVDVDVMPLLKRLCGMRSLKAQRHFVELLTARRKGDSLPPMSGNDKLALNRFGVANMSLAEEQRAEHADQWQSVPVAARPLIKLALTTTGRALASSLAAFILVFIKNVSLSQVVRPQHLGTFVCMHVI
jgi:hypothetical protein